LTGSNGRRRIRENQRPEVAVIFRSGVLAALACAAALAFGPARAQVPAGYPSDYARTVSQARAEGKVVLYAAADQSAVSGLIRDFELLYPGVRVEYRELNSDDLYNRFIGEVTSHHAVADVLWSPAMDLQMKLANDDHAAVYLSPEASQLPAWAIWRNMAYGTTFEPAVFAYNKRFVPESEVPHSHADFMNLLATKRDKYVGKVLTYDVRRSAIGFLFASQDSRALHGFWDFVKLLGDNAVQSEPETAAMVQRIASGRSYLGYNLIGSYTLARARLDPAIGVVMPKDYTLVMSRIALIARTAPHPNAARLWLDYLLSKRGQTLLAQRAEMFAIRGDVAGELTSGKLTEALGTSMKAINVGPGLLVFRDQSKHAEFLRRWEQETQRAAR
jgi:iron(III) transport system substrate-binding protein